MHYEPDTIWGRTVDGDQELVGGRRGLSVAQRRLLKRLTPPRTFATLAARYRLESSKLERELIRLAQLQLVAFQRPGSPQPRTAPLIDPPLCNRELPRATPSHPPLSMCVAAVVLGVCIVLLLAS